MNCDIVEGRQLQKFFRPKTDADKFATIRKAQMRTRGERSRSLSENERIACQAARDKLQTVGATIHRAVDFYFSHHKPLRETLTLKGLLEKAGLDKELAGRLLADLLTNWSADFTLPGLE